MGKRKDDKKPRRGISSNYHSQTNKGEYDLESNFRKIKPYTQKSRKKNLSHGVTDSREEFNQKRFQENYVDSSDQTSPQTSSGSSMWEPYCRLDDKISDYKDKNEAAHTDLRRELEEKIDDLENKQNQKIDSIDSKIGTRLSIQWYYWTIGGIVAIVTVWFVLSYQEVAQAPRQIQSIENRIDNLEKNIPRDNKKNTLRDNAPIDSAHIKNKMD